MQIKKVRYKTRGLKGNEEQEDTFIVENGKYLRVKIISDLIIESFENIVQESDGFINNKGQLIFLGSAA